MAGINFITRVDSFSSLPSEFPEVNKWRVLADGDGYVVTEYENQFRIEGSISTGGGYVGVSFKPECGVLSIGTPARALSPDLVEWGLEKLDEDSGWFIRVDNDGLDEVEDQKRRRLYLQAQDVDDEKHVGIKPTDNGLACRATTSHQRAQWIWRADVPEYLHEEFAPEDARDKVLQAAYEAVYTHPAQGEDLMDLFEKTAEEKAEELRERAKEIRSWRRDSRNLEKMRECRDEWEEIARERKDKIESLKEEINGLQREKHELERELRHERNGSGKLGAVQALMDILDVSPSEAKEAVEAIE